MIFVSWIVVLEPYYHWELNPLAQSRQSHNKSFMERLIRILWKFSILYCRNAQKSTNESLELSFQGYDLSGLGNYTEVI
jgi:hypothetical protein